MIGIPFLLQLCTCGQVALFIWNCSFIYNEDNSAYFMRFSGIYRDRHWDRCLNCGWLVLACCWAELGRSLCLYSHLHWHEGGDLREVDYNLNPFIVWWLQGARLWEQISKEDLWKKCTLQARITAGLCPRLGWGRGALGPELTHPGLTLWGNHRYRLEPLWMEYDSAVLVLVSLA